MIILSIEFDNILGYHLDMNQEKNKGEEKEKGKEKEGEKWEENRGQKGKEKKEENNNSIGDLIDDNKFKEILEYLSTYNLHLEQHQPEHLRRVASILMNNMAYLDTSKMGRGKTVIA